MKGQILILYFEGVGMKKIMFYLFILAIAHGLLISQIEFGTHDRRNFCKHGSCGSVEGKIYDHKTGKQIEEIFSVAISKCDGPVTMAGDLIIHTIHTNNKGEFSFKIDEGEYCLVFFPKSKLSKYHGDPYVASNPDEAIHITVKNGTAINVKKKVKPGGKIKLNFVDLNGESVDLKTLLPPKAQVGLTIRSEKITPYYEFDYKISDFSECRSINNAAYSLKPGVYRGIVDYHTSYNEYSNIGFGSQMVPDIFIEPGVTTEIDVVFDRLNHRTGISGIVKDSNGKIMPGVNIKIYSETSDADGTSYPHFQIKGKDKTNSKGEFKIVGLHEFYNPYYLYIYKKKNGKWVQKKVSNIILIRNTIIIKSFILELGNN